ncbi:uracil DNA N-glycosylase Thp1 [Mycoemilia scoparia]|uniref:Uracil DNA N-glycosylase Thp1 n=1 Tax=Mycoemilia scoparia TaxID=417184 RepID=A0A9W7ZYB8_9FUNG|nr:uracil DNA N-glycosylase Thp1 [Mycoemilia scoparia]
MPRAAALKATENVSKYFTTNSRSSSSPKTTNSSKKKSTRKSPYTIKSEQKLTMKHKTETKEIITTTTATKTKTRTTTAKTKASSNKVSKLLGPDSFKDPITGKIVIPRVVKPSTVDIGSLKPIPETLKPGLDILFIGINPGIQSSLHQRHFANPLNIFWRGLFHAKLVSEPLTAQDEDKLQNTYNMSICNMVDRPSQTSSDISKKEMQDAVPFLLEKIDIYRPKIVCFVGKGIYEVFVGSKCTKLGLQPNALQFPDHEVFPDLPNSIWLFAMPSTSGRTAAYQNPQKLELFCNLKLVYDRIMSGQSPVDLIPK